MERRNAAGREYLVLVTELLQRARLATDEGGEWEAADMQWWWPRDQHADPEDATFWFDDAGRPVAAVTFNDWGHHLGCEVLTIPDATDLAPTTLWPHALARVELLGAKPIEVAVGDNDVATGALLRGAGFAAVEPAAMSCWMPAGDRAAVPTIAAGYSLRSIAERATDPHHMAARNGLHVRERLGECSLYRPELDLYIEAPDGAVAGYGLFWADPVTGVGLVEPMRTEEGHQNKGLGRHLLRSGLELLAQSGCSRLKVTYLENNDPARLLYLGSGFQARTRSQTYQRLPDP